MISNITHKRSEGYYNYDLTESIVSNVPTRLVFKRASIIPFFVLEDVKYYALFLDSRYRELTDCGGAVKKGENFLDSSIRELKEESLEIIDLTSFRKVLGGCKCYYDHERIVIFVQTTKKTLYENSSLAYIRKYQEKVVGYFNGIIPDLSTLENCYLLWLSDSQIENICDGIPQAVNKDNYITYLNTEFREHVKIRMEEFKTVTETPFVNIGFKKKRGSHIEMDPYAISKSKMTPYWFFKIYIEPHKSIVTSIPTIWNPVMFFFKTLLKSKGKLV
jgi:hypothetical protein